jgi:hypothetical protein
MIFGVVKRRRRGMVWWRGRRWCDDDAFCLFKYFFQDIMYRKVMGFPAGDRWSDSVNAGCRVITEYIHIRQKPSPSSRFNVRNKAASMNLQK